MSSQACTGLNRASAFELLNMKAVACSDETYALISRLSTEKGLCHAEALEHLLSSREEELSACREELAKVKAELEETKEKVKQAEMKSARMGMGMKKRSRTAGMSEEEWARLATIGQHDTGAFMREVREKGLLPYD
jgi:chromosome segregation ATPase